MTINRQKIKSWFTLKRLVKYFFAVIFLCSLSAFFYTAKFLYSDFYLSITQSDKIILLKEKVAAESINVKKFESVMKKLNEKSSIGDDQKINDIFD